MTEGNGEVSELPRGWCFASIKDSLIPIRGISFPKDAKQHSFGDGLIACLRTANIQEKVDWTDIWFVDKSYLDREEQIVEKGDILISVSNSFKLLGKVAIINELPYKSTLGTFIANLRIPKHLNSKFIYYYLSAYQFKTNVREQASTTTNISNISIGKLEKINIKIAPIAEQEQIVEKIEELFSALDHGIESLKMAQKQLKIYRQVVLKWAFEGKLTEKWRSQIQQEKLDIQTGEELLAQIKAERENLYQQQLAEWEEAVREWEAIGRSGNKPAKLQKIQDPSPLTTTELATLPELPLGWSYVRAEAISDFITKGTTPSKNELSSGSGDVPFIKVYNLTDNGLLDFTINPTFVSNKTHNKFLSRSKVLPSDVLMNIVGPPLGKVSFVPNTFNEWNINQAIVRYRMIDILSSKYLMYYLLSEVTIDRMSKRAKATAGQFNLTLEICRDIEISICNQVEQEQIVQEIESRLSICDRLEDTIIENLQKAEALRQSILKQAFEGKLVPQDPNDEPAEKLLERIKQEKTKVKKGEQLSIQGI